MKKLILMAAVICFGNLLEAQSDKYTSAMKQNISMLDSIFQKGNSTELANNFERIGDAEKTQWLPYYYAAYCNVLNAYTEKDKTKTDAIADKAEQLITKAETIAGSENSETAVIKSMIASSHMMVDPQNRWQQYGKASTDNIEKAKQLDSTNPRPVYLQGVSKFYTPESFGGGKGPAKEIFLKALPMFDTFKPKSDLEPTWGVINATFFIND